MRRLIAPTLALVAACHPAPSPAAAPTAAAAPSVAHAPEPAPVLDGMVDVGGLSLHVHCMGDGAPLVVMDAGMGGSGTVWQAVQPAIAKTTRVCVYDRAGAGYSDTPPKPRAVAQITKELHALLANARLAGPYVLVGHSMGGLYTRLYAAAFPADVAGMVLVDSSTEDQDTRLWPLYPPEALADNPRDREGITRDAQKVAMADLRGADRSLGDRPLAVLTAGAADPEPGVSPEAAAKIREVWLAMQAELPKLSSNGVQVVAPKSTHYIQFDAPKLVVAAVGEVVGAVREHRKVDAAPLRAALE